MRSEIYRIIDVNMNRATEGMRVVEEVCRFVLEDRKLTLALKKLRGALSRVVKAHEGPRGLRRLRARRAMEDIGREMYTKAEGRRVNIEGIFRANMKRSQEAVRCLEEFSKLIDPKFGKRFKDLRFKLYDLEKRIAPRVSKIVKLDFDLYVITDPQFGHLKIVRKAIASGVKIIQFRDKTISKRKYLHLARMIAAITRKAGMTFMLNDHWNLVNEAGADGIHLGQEDLKKITIRRVKKALGGEKIIGVSVRSVKEARKAEKEGADYVAVGPVFLTPLKPEGKPVGLKVLREVVRRVKIPVVAVGGIDKSNIHNVRRAGCRRVAVIRAFSELRSSQFRHGGDCSF